MLYEFRSRATGSVTMVGKAAEQVLKIIGKSPDATGIITVAQIPAAIAALEQAAEREQPPAIGSTITYRYRGLTRKGTPRFATYLRPRADTPPAP